MMKELICKDLHLFAENLVQDIQEFNENSLKKDGWPAAGIISEALSTRMVSSKNLNFLSCFFSRHAIKPTGTLPRHFQ